MDRSSQVVMGLLFAGLSLVASARGAEEPKPDSAPKTTAEAVPLPDDNATKPAPAASSTEPAVPITPPADPAPTPAPKKSGAATVTPPPATVGGAATPPGAAAGDDTDLIGDKPEAVAAAKPKPLMEDLTPDGPVSTKASHCYDTLAALKTHMEQISKDLDNGGKEVTRLIKSSDALAKKITDLADIWSDEDQFRDICGTAKRDALNLNTELSQVPRAWSHVRWSYNDTLADVRKIRLVAKELADAEPKPVAVTGKDGKVTYVDAAPNVNPAIVKRDMKKAEAEAMRNRARKIEDLRRNPPLQTDLPKSE